MVFITIIYGQGAFTPPTTNFIGHLRSPEKFGQGSKNPTTNVIGDRRSPETFGGVFLKHIIQFGKHFLS